MSDATMATQQSAHRRHSKSSARRSLGLSLDQQQAAGLILGFLGESFAVAANAGVTIAVIVLRHYHGLFSGHQGTLNTMALLMLISGLISLGSLALVSQRAITSRMPAAASDWAAPGFMLGAAFAIDSVALAQGLLPGRGQQSLGSAALTLSAIAAAVALLAILLASTGYFITYRARRQQAEVLQY
jgi:hypothetical protein